VCGLGQGVWTIAWDGATDTLKDQRVFLIMLPSSPW
jgi:hypothetical protein